ncbi:rhamnosyltransferase [Luteibacter sp. W1I16]|uniref:glycosyltransferase family 2 protein n=1 Tax=Luteibacter sp. W1I16 TaxID=3373922 RepID=UPI003D1B3AB7
MEHKPRFLTIDELASVTVTFNPDLVLLKKQLQALVDVGLRVIVDNASSAEIREQLRILATNSRSLLLVEKDVNAGLGAALNEGMVSARIHAPGSRAVLLLDQDSTFAPNVPRGLLDALNRVQSETGTLCCVGPALVDPSAGMQHGFHYVAHGWLWARAFPSADAGPFPVANLNGSGTTMSLDMVDRIGELDSKLFIDHVDTEWSFRVTSHGFHLFGIPWLSFEHRMGNRGRRLWLLGWRVWPERSPIRHYYLYRNTIKLLRRRYVPVVWKTWAVAKAVLTLCVVTLYGPGRTEQWRKICRGMVDGVRDEERG